MSERVWNVTCGEHCVVCHAQPAVQFAGEGRWTGWTEWTEGTERMYRGGGVEMRVRVSARGEWIAVESAVRNVSAAALKLEKITVLEGELAHGESAFDRCFVQGPTMCEVAAVQPLDQLTHAASHMVAGFTRRGGGAALVTGFLTHDASFNRIEITRTADGRVRVNAAVARDGVALAAGAELTLPVLMMGAGAGLQALLGEYAGLVAEAMGARRPRGGVMTGWCSWYGYYGTESADDVSANVALLAQPPWRGHVRAIQIDDGWNVAAPGGPRVWGDWHAGYKFPQGMRAAAEVIKAQGMLAGLWLAPFSVERASSIYREHPEWLIRDEQGAPKEFWTVFGLDLTNPAVLDFVYETFQRVFGEWGFEYVKIDFLVHAIQPGARHDNQQTTAQLFRNGLAQIRRAAGERFILNCGSPLGPAIGMCDAMRIGYDVSSRWTAMVNAQGWVVGNCAIKPAAVQTIGRQWMHGRLWQNDPDCVVTRDYGTPGEKKVFGDGAYGLTDEEAALWVRLVWLTGNMTLLSEIMPELRGPRLELLQRVFPVNAEPARVVDWYVQPELHVLAAPGRVGVFNLGDEHVRVDVPLERCGMAARVALREWLSGERIRCEGELVCEVPGHGGRVWEEE